MQDVVSFSEAISVSDALSVANSVLKEIVFVVQGEVCDVKDRLNYKAVYFSIKDDKSVLKCHIWKNRYDPDDVSLNEGTLVNLTGRFSVYAKRGDMSFDVFSIEKAGEGDLRARVNRLIDKFKIAGFLDPQNKKDLPKYPEKIGLITSGSGAVVHDVLRTIRRRAKSLEICFYGVNVEGKDAPSQIADAISALDEQGLDAILLVRGGGSFEDLMPFNDEGLCTSIFKCKTPIITGIGHEPDTTVADLVADVRASTPTAASEIITQNLFDLQQRIYEDEDLLRDIVSFIFESSKHKVESLKSRLYLTSPVIVFESQKIRFDFKRDKMLTIANELLKDKRLRIDFYAKRLEALSPLSVLSRGYSCTYNKSNRLVKSFNDCNVGDLVSIRLIEGLLSCEVKEKVEIKKEI